MKTHVQDTFPVQAFFKVRHARLRERTLKTDPFFFCKFTLSQSVKSVFNTIQ